MTHQTPEVYDILKFRETDSPQEAELRFIVIEVRGPRVLVECLNDQAKSHNVHYVTPQHVYLLSDMTEA